MTIICAARQGNAVAIASDTQTTYGSAKLDTGPKWQRYGKWWLALAGNAHANTALAAASVQQAFADCGNPAMIAAIFASVLDEAGWAGGERDGEYVVPDRFDVEGLIVGPGGIFILTNNLAVLPGGNFAAAGIGAMAAYGVASYFNSVSLALATDPAYRVRSAVDAAMECVEACGGNAWTYQFDLPE